MAVDPATGAVAWKRDDIKKLKECNYDEIAGTAFGMFDAGEGVGGTQRRVEVIDLATGVKKWDSSNLPMASSQGVLVVPQKGMLIVAGAPKKGSTKTTLIGVDAETGEMKWQKDGLFTKNVVLREVRGSGKLFKRYAIEGCQPPVFDTDDTAILFLTEEGPVKIDLNTGEKLWTADKLKGEDPSAVSEGYAPMLHDNGVVFVPYKKSVMAVDAKTGAPMWPKDHDFKSRVAQMALTPQGLVVRGQPQLNAKGKLDGKPFIDVLDPKTGESVWKKPFKDMEGATTFDLAGDRLFIAADGELFSIGLADGVAKSVTKIKFKGNEDPTRLEVHDGEYVLASSQNVMRLSPAGEVRYHTFYPAPGQSGWIKVLSTAAVMTMNAASASYAHSQAMANPGTTYRYTLYGNPELSRRFKASTHAREYAAIQTQVEDGGRKGSGLVKVSKTDGKEVARCYLGDKTPEYEMDEIDGRVYFRKTNTQIVAFPF
jgi:outer membrane protein assembly factor BamB